MYPCLVSYPANLTSPTCTHVQLFSQQSLPHPHVPMLSQLPQRFLPHPHGPMFSQQRTHMYPCSVSYPAGFTSSTRKAACHDLSQIYSLSRGSPALSCKCFLNCSLRSLLTPMSWNILCSLDVYSKPHAC